MAFDESSRWRFISSSSLSFQQLCRVQVKNKLPAVKRRGAETILMETASTKHIRDRSLLVAIDSI